MSRDSQKYYKFALVGWTGSGKTSYLTALALGNFGSSTEMTCVRMPVMAKDKTIPTSDDADNDFEALKSGEKLIEDALIQVKQGNVPFATGLGVLENKVLPTIEFKISTPEISSILVRTVDYPGELINPKDLKKADTGASILQDILSSFDGLLIITGVLDTKDAPATEDEKKSQAEEMLTLTQSFTALAELNNKDLDRTPVAIALTKWDRTPHFNPVVKDTDAQDIETFLDKNSAVDTLFKTIANAIGDQAKGGSVHNSPGYIKGNSALFVTSAFGKNRPDINVSSYGLVNPLLWLVERRDFLDTQYIEEQWEKRKLSKWMPWNSYTCSRTTQSMLKRVSRRSESYLRLERIRNEARVLLSAVTIPTVLLSLVFGDFIFGQYLKSNLRGINSEIQSLSTGLTRLATLEKDLNWVGKVKGLTFINNSLLVEIDKTRGSIRNKIEDQYYMVFKTATNDGVKYDAAKEYIKQLPNGIHFLECKSFIQEHEINTNEKTLVGLEAKAPLIIKNNDIKNIQSFLEEIVSGVSYPTNMTSDHMKRLDGLKVQANDAIVRITAMIEWGIFFTTFDTALKTSDFKQTTNLLINRSPKDRQWNDLAITFPDLVEKTVSRKVDDSLKLNEYEEALKTISNAVESLKSFELNVRSSDPMLADKQVTGQQKVQKIKQTVEKKYDEYLYSIVKKNKNAYACEKYKEKSPTKRMEKAVDTYMDYIKSLSQERMITCLVRIKWHPDYNYGDDNKLVIRVNNDVKFAPMVAIPSNRGEVSDNLGTLAVFVKSLDESFTVNATLVEEDFPDADDDGGRGEMSVKANEMLRTDVSIPLRIENTNIENELLLRLDPTSIPQEPELPEYKS